MKDKFGQFEEAIKACIYNANYRILQELGASGEMLKAYGEYEKAPITELQKATGYIVAWQQAKAAEVMKEAFLEGQRQQEKTKAGYKEKRDFGIMEAEEIKKYLS